MKYSLFTFLTFLCLSNIFSPDNLVAAIGNISETDKYAWGESSGWINFRPAHAGITIHDTHISGFIWAADIGWIKLGADITGPYLNNTKDNWGINRDITGALSGYAWSETAGWINFNPSHSQVSIDPPTGIFSGYAWAANLGYIHFQNNTPAYHVQTTNIDLDGDTILTESDICRDGDDRLDYDGDGTPDFCDPCPENNPDDADSDGDMIADCIDAFPYQSEYNTDTDSDGLPDLWETTNGLDKTFNDADADKDNDGLTNLEEFTLGTSPGNTDSDGDGLSDLWEVETGLDPLTCVALEDSEPDFDVDGINLAQFIRLFTDKSNEADINGDSVINTLDLAKISATFSRGNICQAD